MNKCIRAMLYSSTSRRFGVSTTGIFISVPASARIGDKLCVLLGCNFLVVLRGGKKGGGVVGECGGLRGKVT